MGPFTSLVDAVVCFLVEGWDDLIMFLSLVTTIESDLGHVAVVWPPSQDAIVTTRMTSGMPT